MANLRKIAMMFIDIGLIISALLLAFLIRFEWILIPDIYIAFIQVLIWAIVIKVLVFYCFGLYQWTFRYASLSEGINVLRAVTVGTLFLISIEFFFRHQTIGRSILIIDYLLTLFFITGSRFIPRVMMKIAQARRKGKYRALIIGAGSAGQMVVREMVNSGSSVYKPIGFVDDDPMKLRSRISGVKVLGTIDDVEYLVRQNMITDIIIAVPSASGEAMRSIISRCQQTTARIKTLPALHKILSGEVTVKQIRDVEPQDLLGRETVTIDTQAINELLRGKVVLVTGAAGSIGRELCRQIVRFFPRELIFFDHNENDLYFLQLELKKNFPSIAQRAIIGDIRDIGLLKKAFTEFKPQVVFHSAAHKHVPLMEENPAAAIKNNVMGTRNLMYAAVHYGVESFVMISTDKAVRPTSVMGASKRIAEMIMLAKADNVRTKFMAVRFGNVLGSSGSVVPIFKKQIEEGGPITVTHPDVRRFFMTASEAAQLVMQAGSIGKGGEIFILDMGEQIKIVDLARELIVLSGLKPGEDIEIKFTGLRPGEKLYEEMLHNAEEDKTTKHEKIYIASPDNFNKGELRRKVRELGRLADRMENEKIIEMLKELIPSYTPMRDNL